MAPRTFALLVRATNVVLSAWLAFQVWSLLSSAEPRHYYFVIPQAAVGLLLACLVLLRAPPRDVRIDAASVAAVVVSNWHFLLFDHSVPTSTPAATVGSVLLVGAVYLGAYAHLTLGRSFSILPAVRELRTRGPYRAVRHPIYLALVLSDVGLALSLPGYRNAALALAGITAHVLRVLQEERMWLRRSAYRQYRRQTPYRLVPFLF